MEFKKIEKNGIICAVVVADEPVITDAQSALDVLMSAKYDAGTKNIVIDKKLIVEEFFILSSGLAGEILQKYINYGGRIAIYGDYSHYIVASNTAENARREQEKLAGKTKDSQKLFNAV